MKFGFLKMIRKYAILIVLIVLVVVFSVLSPAFATFNNAMNVVRQISMMGIVTVGFTFILLGGGMDLSVGSQMAVMNVAVAMLIRDVIMNPVLAILIGIAMTTIIGWFNGFAISKTGIPPLIATLAMQTALRGVSFILSKGRPVYGVPDSVKFIGQGYLFGILPIPGVILAAVVAFGIILLNKTYLGRHFYALGSNPEATRLSGINIHFTRTMTYTLNGFLTGIAALVMMTRVGSGQPNAADGFEMNVLTAAVLGGVSINGGKGSISGAMAGAVIIGVLNNGMSICGANDYWQKVITGLVLFVVVVLDSLSQAKRKDS